VSASASDALQAPVPLRRNRDFILLWSGQLVSTVGTRISAIAYPLLVLTTTGSPAKAGLVGFAQSIPFALVYLPAGVFVDRWNRKRIMLVADGGRALALASVVVALALDGLTLAQILFVAVVEGTLFIFFQLAESAALPQIVPRAQLGTAVAQNEAREQGAELAGGPLGGILFAIDRFVPFLVDAISYAVGFVTLLFLRSELQEEREPRKTNIRAEIAEGIRWLWEERFLRVVVALVGGTNFVLNALFLTLIVRARDLDASPPLIGAMFAFFGAGAILGAFVAPAVQRHVAPRIVILLALWVWAVETATLFVLPNAVALGAVFGLIGFLGPPFNVTLASYRYALVPDRLLARVGSVGRLVAWGTIPLAYLTAGILLAAIGAPAMLLTLAALMIVVAASATLISDVRNVPPPDVLRAAREARA
jgi:MFS family permease